MWWFFRTKPKPMSTIHTVKATSFADPKDVEAFQRAKERGLSDREAFKFGDNGIGFWGDNTAQLVHPMVALPPETLIETWGSVNNAEHKIIQVCNAINGKCSNATVADTMPHRSNITNGAGLDMNPALCKLLGLVPPVSHQVTWQALSS